MRIIGNSQYLPMVIVHQVTAPQNECVSIIETGGDLVYNKLPHLAHGGSEFRPDDFKQWIIYTELARHADAGLEWYICLSVPSLPRNELVRRWVQLGIGSCTR